LRIWILARACHAPAKTGIKQTWLPSVTAWQPMVYINVPGGIRTHNLWLRRPTRYPLRYGNNKKPDRGIIPWPVFQQDSSYKADIRFRQTENSSGLQSHLTTVIYGL